MGKIKRKEVSKGANLNPTSYTQAERGLDYPVFCLKHLHRAYGLDRCDNSEKSDLVERLKDLCSMSWSEIKVAHRHGFGTEKIDSSAIRAPIPNSVAQDVTYLALRFSGKKPMVGYRNGSVFHIVFIDNKFDVYAH
jgi:hypothetical protein